MISNHTKITFNTFCSKIVENESKENLVIRKQKILKRCMRELKTITLVLYVVDFLFLENEDINKTDKNGNNSLPLVSRHINPPSLPLVRRKILVWDFP
jgi:hypothetical protein